MARRTCGDFLLRTLNQPPMAPAFLRRANSPTCFYCLSAVSPAPSDPRSYRCPHCGCWNRFDANGEITSDEPAMHDEKLNTSSFAKRGAYHPTLSLQCCSLFPPTASPNKDRLPSTYAKPPFCHTCQTNQMLLVNLLSNYLPPPQASPSQNAYIYISNHAFAAPRLRPPPRTAPCVPPIVARAIPSGLCQLPPRSSRRDRAEKSDGANESVGRLAQRKQG